MKSNVSLMDLREGMCACLVPEEPYPQYCGLPVTHWPRMCKYHAKAYLHQPKEKGNGNIPEVSKSHKAKRSAIAFRAVRTG